MINALQFIGVIDEDGKRTSNGHEVLLLPDEQFQTEFENLVRLAYSDLFELRGDDAWRMTKSDLTSYFRTTDKTSEVIGGRQASLFQVFGSLAGREMTTDNIASKSASSSRRSKAKPASQPQSKNPSKTEPRGKIVDELKGSKDMALTVRIEINLPSSGSKETYDNIFKSIRTNLYV